METSRKATATLTLAVILLIVLTSCSSEDDPLRIADKNMERTDLVVEGDLELNDFRQIEDANSSTDLISYNFYGMDSRYFDFIIDLESGYTLTIQVYDAQRLNPWKQVDVPYNIYPGQDLEDKLYYTNIMFTGPDGSSSYSTNFDNNIPRGTFIDVFKIIRNDGDEIQCRIRDMILYRTNSTDRTITINGTFVGVLDLSL